ncbi:MAG: Hint domain-containing protein [Pseudomonadota bacterium]
MSIQFGKDSGDTLARAMNRLSGRSRSARQAAGVSPKERALDSVNAAKQKAQSELHAAERRLQSRTAVRENDLELWPLPGIAAMTRVRTSFGDVHAAALRKGDEVLTREGYKPIEWLNRIHLDDHILRLKPDSNPIVIAAGALGPNLPSHEIMVSPRQIVCGEGNTDLTKPREAAMLISRPGARRLIETCLSYTMFHVGESADVMCEGVYLRFPMEA